jgi:hypothetical protein
MTFTNKDLTRLKDTIHRHEVCLGDSGKLVSLIARLEAAEMCVKDCLNNENCCRSANSDELSHAELWHQAIGWKE